MGRPIVIFDLETTGVDVEADRIVQLAALKVDDRFVEQDRLVLNINPTIPIPKGASNVHGIYDKDVRDCKTFSEVADDVANFFLNCDLAGYNLYRFDLPMLHKELRRARLALPTCVVNIIDAWAVFRQYEKKRKGTKLTDAYRTYCEEELGADAHNAFADTSATAAVLEMQLERYRDHYKWPVQRVQDFHRWTMSDRIDPTGKLRWGLSWDDSHKLIELNFGKFKGRRLEELAKKESSYLEWMLGGNFSAEVKGLIEMALNGTFYTRPYPEVEEEKPDTNEAAKAMVDQSHHRCRNNNSDKEEQIEFLLKRIREELEKPGAYYDYRQTVPWNLDERRSMGVMTTELRIYTERPVEKLQPKE